MKNKLTSEKLKLICLNLSDEISKGDNFLSNKDVTIFNSSIIEIKNSNNLLIASRGWYGNVRSWDGINFVIISLFTNKLKKIKQTILDIDPKLINDIYILINQLNDKKKRHMFISKVDLNNLTYGDKIEICKDLSTDFEKNWGPFTHKNKLYMIYDINPLKIFELDDNFNCKLVCNINDKILQKFSESYPDLDFHIRNSTNLIPIGNNQYLGLGHGVLDYKNNTDINKFLIPSIDKSKYSQNDKDYFKRFHKLYTGFFYKLDMNSKEITEISPFFQLPNYESKQELIFFPTSIYLDDNKYVNISYNVGDNRTYFLRLHLDIIDISLYDKYSVDFQLNHNINQNYYLELIRNIRKSLGYPVQKKKYYRFGDVDRLYASKRKRLKNKRKTQRKK